MSEPEKSTVIAHRGVDSDDATEGRLGELDGRPLKTVVEKYADVTLRLVEEYGDNLEPLNVADERILKRKLYLNVTLLVWVITLVLFIDKATLSYASILGLFEETGIDQTQYNNLNTIFYTGYIVAQWPGHYLMQRLPFGKFIAATIFTWSIIIFLHCTAENYGGLIALRFFLGAVEAIVVPALEITLGMFFTREEQAWMQPIFWTACLGANVPAGFIAYGLLFTHTSVRPWKLFMIVTASSTLVLSIYSWFWYPSNPAEAKFLTLEEKVHAIKRVHKSTQSSIEQKHFKKEQFLETLRDPVSWLFSLQTFCLMLANNLQFQQNLIFTSLGVSNLGSTLVSAAGAGFSVACALVGAYLIRRFPNKTAWWYVFWVSGGLAGGIGMVTVNWENKLGLLACEIIAGNTYGVGYILALGWTTSSAAGYTKKLTRNVMFMIAYGISNIIAPQIWAAKDGPRYYPAWIVQIVLAFALSPAIMLYIHYILSRRNEERRIWIEEQRSLGLDRDGVVEQMDDGNRVVKAKVDLALLDLTDLENKYFLYPL